MWDWIGLDGISQTTRNARAHGGAKKAYFVSYTLLQSCIEFQMCVRMLVVITSSIAAAERLRLIKSELRLTSN